MFRMNTHFLNSQKQGVYFYTGSTIKAGKQTAKPELVTLQPAASYASKVITYIVFITKIRVISFIRQKNLSQINAKAVGRLAY